jgi:hypothetical protein
MPPKKPIAKELITYLCGRCVQECTRTELEKTPKCVFCAKTDRMQEVNRRPITREALEEGMMRSMERMLVSLEKAYASRPDDMSDADEILLLQAMAKAKNLEKGIEKAFVKKTKKRTTLHHVKMEL